LHEYYRRRNVKSYQRLCKESEGGSVMDIETLRNEVIEEKYAKYSDGSKGSTYLYKAIIAEVNDMSDEEVKAYAQDAGLTDED